MSKQLSAKKRDRQNERRRLRNKSVKSRLKTTVKKTSAEPSPENLREAYSALDRATKTHTVHRRTAARIKSNLARRAASEKPE